MADFLRNAVGWLAGVRQSNLASQVTYSRNGEPQTMAATWGETGYEVEASNGMTVGSAVIDFLIAAAALPYEPQPGDVIDADDRRYEVMALGDDMDGWRWSGPPGTTYRIHTRDIGTNGM